MHSAASIGNLECVEALLSAGADVTKKNEGGRTALHYAARFVPPLRAACIVDAAGAKLRLRLQPDLAG